MSELTTFILSTRPATYVKPGGTLFIRLITMIAAPLVLASLVVGASSISDPKKLGRIGGKTVGLYLLTTAIASRPVSCSPG